jgi:hypothetical protein
MTIHPNLIALREGTTSVVPGFPAMRIPEENRNLVLLATVTLFTAAIAWAVALVDPAPTQAASKPAYLADQAPVRVVGPSFEPNTNPREHR